MRSNRNDFRRNVADVNLNFGVQQVLVELEHHPVYQLVVFPQFPDEKMNAWFEFTCKGGYRFEVLVCAVYR